MHKKSLLIVAALVCFAIPNLKAQGYWTSGKITTVSARSYSISLAIGNYAYLGTGIIDTSTQQGTKDFWRFNPDSGTWTQMANFIGKARWGCFGFAIGLNAYIGAGKDSMGIYYDDFYKYDIGGNAWSFKSAFPGGARMGGIGMSNNGIGYAGLGWNGSNYFDDWYEYNPTSDTWTIKSNFIGGTVNYPVGFAIGDKCYVGLGYDGNNYHSEFYKYDPATDSWGGITSFPGSARNGAAGFVLGPYAFVTAGSDTGHLNDCYRLDTTTTFWIKMTDFPGTTRFAASFGIKGRGYVLMGDSLNSLLSNIWIYDTLNIWTKVNSTVWCSGSILSANIVTNDSLETNNTFEMYISDSSGSFVNATSLGTISAYQSTGYTVKLPNNLPIGNNYQLRTVSTNPVLIGTTSDQILTIRPLPTTTVIAGGSTTICGGGSVGLWVDSTSANYHKNMLTIIYDATLGQSTLSGANKVYIHSGVTDTNSVGSNWVNTVGNYGQDDGIGQMDSLGNNMWSITLDVPSFYSLGYGYPAKYIGMVFRNEDGTKDGKDSSGNEVYIDLQTGAVISSTFNGVKAEYENIVQWQVYGVDINGANHASFLATTGGDYRAVVSGGYCADTSSITTVISGTAPQVNLKYSTTSACLSSQNFTFSDSSTGAVFIRLWDFGDNTFDTALSVSHTYTASGTYNVKLYVFAVGGCFTYDSVKIYVESGPAISFTIDNSHQCFLGNSFTFTDSSKVNSGSITKWWWDFGDGVTDTNQNTSHSYTADGNFSVKLKAMSSTGCIDSGSMAANVHPLPKVKFGVNATTQCLNGNNFAFTDSSSVSSGSIVLSFWDFGDGDTSTMTNPSHSYKGVNTYTVVLYALTDESCWDSAFTNVDVLSKPTASVAITGDTTFCQGDSVTFKATPSGLAYQWYLNGSTINGATAAIYSTMASGNYSVAVIANGGCGDTSRKYSVTVNTTTSATANAASSTSFCQGGSVDLNATAGANLSYQWLMNGSAINGATAATYNATASGDYSVIVATNGACSDTSTAITVTVTTKTTATATAAGATTFCLGGSVVLNAVTGSGLTYEWLMNGTTISGATADSYTATASGDYQVLVNPGVCSDTSTAIAVIVMPVTTATATAAGATTFCQGSSVTINGNSSGGLAFQWLKDGAIISGATSNSYTATTSGDYRVVVTPTGGCNDTSSAITLTVTAKATIGTITGSTTSLTNTSKTYSVANISGATFNWVVTGGTISNGQGTSSVTILWGAVGAGSIKVNTDCSDTSSLATTVHVGIMAADLLRLNVYPNPTSNLLNIELPQATSGTLTLTDMAGKTIQHWTMQQSNLSIRMASLPAGVYMVQYSSPAFTLRERVVLTK